MPEMAPTGGLPRIIFNSDGDQGLSIGDLSQRPDLVCRTVDELAGTQVDAFSYSICTGGDTFCHRSEVAPILGDDFVEGGDMPEFAGLRARNIRWLHSRGTDPLAEVGKRCRELGMQCWASLRMNDDHDSYPGHEWLHGSYRAAHPELLIGSPYPGDEASAASKPEFCWAFDYAHQAVRDRQLALVEELLAKYDIDGIELDFLRGAHYFRREAEAAGMPLLTGFVDRVRGLVDDAAGRRGRPILVAARVQPTVTRCIQHGLDVESWIRNRSVDLVIPMGAGRLDMEIQLEAFVRLTDGTTCTVAGGLEGRCYGYGLLPDSDTGLWRHPTLPMMRAAAATCFSKGARSTYLFNYEHRLRGFEAPYTHDEIQALKEIGSPDAIDGRDKRYVVTVDQNCEFEGVLGSRTRQLPALLTGTCRERAFTVHLGEDLDRARRDGRLRAVRVRITARYVGGSIDAPHATRVLPDHVCVLLNGQPIECDWNPWRTHGLLYTDIPANQGQNSLRIAVSDAARIEDHALHITGIELIVNYAGAAASLDRD